MQSGLVLHLVVGAWQLPPTNLDYQAFFTRLAGDRHYQSVSAVLRGSSDGKRIIYNTYDD